MNTQEMGVSTIRLPDEQIECARNYPFTYISNAALRGLRRRYEALVKAKTGSVVELLFPTVLNQVIVDLLVRLYKEEGFELQESDFESSVEYNRYLKIIQA